MKKKTISSYLRTFRYVISLLAIINLLSCNEAIETMPKKIDETRDNTLDNQHIIGRAKNRRVEIRLSE